MTTTSTTISLKPIPNLFHTFSLEGAENIIYNQLVPACEAKGVMLSRYGNHASAKGVRNIEQYERLKEEHDLFNIEKVQAAFASINFVLRRTAQYEVSSYYLGDVMGELDHGDLIAAMLLKGYSARFAKKGEPLDVNCMFKAQVNLEAIQRINWAAQSK